MKPVEMATSPEPWQPGQLIANRYEVLEHLGTGGMGVRLSLEEPRHQPLAVDQRVRAVKAAIDEEADRPFVVMEF